jgi:dihydrofolate reductase / thymidylate synthase
MKPSFAIIAAVDADLGIGKNGTLPWQLPADLKHFKTVTMAGAANKKNVVIMGRKTWDSLPAQFRPLPGRINLVLSRQSSLRLPPEVLNADSLETAMRLLSEGPLKALVDNIFVIGGAEIFRQSVAQPTCRKLYLTHIQQSFGCDCFFPKDYLSYFKPAKKSEPATQNSLDYFFAEYNRALF